MNLLELRKNILTVLLVSFMALGMAACSSTDDPPPEDASSSDDFSREDCATYPTEDMQAECELAKELLQ